MPRDVFRIAFSASMSAEERDTGEVMLYGEIVQDYSRFYKDQYPNNKSAVDFDRELKELKAKGARRLKLRINSPGGIVNEAVAMRGALTGAGFERIEIHIEGVCASAATLIASIPDAHVVISPGSEYMIHNPWTCACGNANELERVSEHMRQLEATSRGFYVKKTGQSEDQIKSWMDEETWFTAEDAVKHGFADELASESVGEKLPASACVTATEMACMRALYRNVPKQIAVLEANVEAPQEEPVSNAAPVAGDATEIHNEEETHMDIKDITQEQLLAENPALVEKIRQSALDEDRQRRDDIDAITPPVAEYEMMAEEAKRNGTAFTAYQRSLVAAMRQKGESHLEKRKAETMAANAVTGGASGDVDGGDDEIMQYAKAVAKMAKESADGGSGIMY